jgi:hypothetical protein
VVENESRVRCIFEQKAGRAATAITQLFDRAGSMRLRLRSNCLGQVRRGIVWVLFDSASRLGRAQGVITVVIVGGCGRVSTCALLAGV